MPTVKIEAQISALDLLQSVQQLNQLELTEQVERYQAQRDD